MEYNLYSTENIFWYLFFFLFPSSLGFILCDHTTEILNVIAPQSKQHNILLLNYSMSFLLHL